MAGAELKTRGMLVVAFDAAAAAAGLELGVAVVGLETVPADIESDGEMSRGMLIASEAGTLHRVLMGVSSDVEGREHSAADPHMERLETGAERVPQVLPEDAWHVPLEKHFLGWAGFEPIIGMP